MESKVKVGILGAGFGGLYALFYIRKYLSGDIEVTLFDKNNYLLYTPVLHEMATGTVNPRHVVVPIRKVIPSRQVHIRCEEVTRSISLIDRSRLYPGVSISIFSSLHLEVRRTSTVFRISAKIASRLKRPWMPCS